MEEHGGEAGFFLTDHTRSAVTATAAGVPNAAEMNREVVPRATLMPWVMLSPCITAVTSSFRTGVLGMRKVLNYYNLVERLGYISKHPIKLPQSKQLPASPSLSQWHTLNVWYLTHFQSGTKTAYVIDNGTAFIFLTVP